MDANAMEMSLKAGYPVTLSQVGLFADGAAVKQVGAETFRICSGNAGTPGLDGVVQVTNDELCAAIKDVFVETRVILEPAGALGIAGLKKWALTGGVDDETTLIAVTSGANLNFDRLRFVADRAALGEAREALMAVVIPERPGRCDTFI